ncbi:hypothetical protein OLMES_4180 [Oleiphilus messinensis]|uniref:DUF4124 domain-containing protein n=1 Tax=Oleiphilus messinensis TaxID=141451 RepID=A0A1Y0IEH4_9GAMM|nr:DUF4124 domain-containing protein [Oleiphilus messinensis]ARU58196.1 hypothetical protein OLMES_4180 [Oleiphilus messinensis]
MNRPILCAAILALTLSPLSHGGKLYKIVDKDGNVTFSQFPPSPQETTEGTQVEEKKTRGQGETAISVKGLVKYCGDIALPSEEKRGDYFYADVSNRLESWERQLEYKEQRLQNKQASYTQSAKYSGYYGSSSSRSQSMVEGSQEIGQELRDLRCAISWAKSQHRASVDSRIDAQNEMGRLQQNLRDIELKRAHHCGQEPEYNPSDSQNAYLRSRWQECSREYRADIRRLERMIRQESRKLERY